MSKAASKALKKMVMEEIAGLQELQAPQYNTLRSVAPVWQVFPGPGLGPGPMANSVVWRSDVWTRVEAATVPIPYFGGRRVPMPYVKLQHNQTGQQVWFANFHNPADAHGPAQKWRNAAVAIEAQLANRLTADGTPLVMTGDFNDRAEFFCPITRSSSLRAANGGSTGSACASGKEAPSHVLQAMGVAEEDTDRVVRFSSGWETTADDWQALAEGVAEVTAAMAVALRPEPRSMALSSSMSTSLPSPTFLSLSRPS